MDGEGDHTKCGGGVVGSAAAVLALGFDLLFFAVSELPATLPIALSLALLGLRDHARTAAPDTPTRPLPVAEALIGPP